MTSFEEEQTISFWRSKGFPNYDHLDYLKGCEKDHLLNGEWDAARICHNEIQSLEARDKFTKDMKNY